MRCLIWLKRPIRVFQSVTSALSAIYVMASATSVAPLEVLLYRTLYKYIRGYKLVCSYSLGSRIRARLYAPERNGHKYESDFSKQ